MKNHKQIGFHGSDDWHGCSRCLILIRKKLVFSTDFSGRKYITTALFVIVSILIGTLIVCLTSIKSKYICQHIHRRTVIEIKTYKSRPQSVSINHFNNDHHLDYVVANAGFHTIDTFLGQNNGTFQHHVTYSTGSHSQPSSVATGNLDNQGGIDIAVANFGTNNILVFAGLTNGNFTLTQSFSTRSSHPLMIALADLNNDHRLDIVVLNYGTSSVSIYVASESTSFVFLINYSTGYDSLPKSLTIADLNKDNQLDIVVANYGTNNIGLFFGNGNGIFGDQKIFSTGIGSNPSSVSVGDIDHDDYLDIIVANYGTNDIGIYFGDRTGYFTRQMTYTTGMNSYLVFVAVHDLNGDNHLDIVAVDSVNEKIYVLPGSENGTFPLLSMYMTDVGSNPVSMAGADFNNDNRTDVLIVNRGANNILVLMEYDIELSASYSAFTSKTFYQAGSIATGDLNGDNILDMVATDDSTGCISVFLGYGNGSFMPFVALFNNKNTVLYTVQLGDFNNDHQLDIAVRDPSHDSINILFGYGNGNFSSATTYSTKPVLSPSSLAIGDVNNDNCLDIVVTSVSSGSMGIFIGDCNATFQMTILYKTAADWGPNGIVIDDFNSDNHVDLAITYAWYNGFSIYFGDGNGHFSLSQTYVVNDTVISGAIVASDFNSDNHTDLALGVYNLNKITILFGSKNGTFVNETVYPIKSCGHLGSIIVGDFNSDHQLDLAVGCPLSSKMMILFGNGHGEFLSNATYSTGEKSYPVPLASADFDNDHRLDIVISDYSGHKIGIWMNYYEANFAVQSKYRTGSSPQPYSVAIADLNNDNISDLVIANSGNKNIAVRLGFGNGSFGIETVFPTGSNSFPRHVTVGDLNRDGQEDMVIVNSEGNSITVSLGNGNGTFESIVTYSMGFQSHPTSVAIANMNNDKWLDLVVANYGTDNLGILYGYDYATFALHQTYSTDSELLGQVVLVADMNNDTRLDIVVPDSQLDNIAILFGDGNGSFSTQITYSAGNNSRPRAIAVGDMNGDGWLDMIVANDGTDSIGVSLAHGNGTFGIMIIHPIGLGSVPSFVVVGDINNDKKLDVLVADEGRDNVGVFLGFGNGSLTIITTHSTDAYSRPCSLALGDFNNDGYLDMVVALPGLDTIGVSQGYGNGSFTTLITYYFRRGSQPKSVALGDFNNDGQLDIAVTNSGFGNVVIFFGFGNGSFTYADAGHLSRTLGLPSYLIVDDFNDDNQSDIAVINTENSAFSILFGRKNGDFVQGRLYTTSGGFPSKAMACGDLNNDSHLDLVIINIADGTIDVFLQNGNELFGMPFIESTELGSKPYFVGVGDFDHDNQSDIVVANYGTDNIGIIRGNVLKYPLNPTTYSTGVGARPCALVVADFNDDDQLDIAVVNSGTNSIIIFRGFENGSFSVMESYSTGIGSIPRSIAVTDFNNDHRLDLTIANAGANEVLILFGLGNGSFGNARSYSMGYDSRPYSVAVGDFDHDGWMDIAVANFGADYVEIFLQPC